MVGVAALSSVNLLGEEISLSRIFTAVGLVAMSLLLGLILRWVVLRHSTRRGSAHRGSWYTVSRMVLYAILALGILSAVSVLGISTDRFAWLAGALGGARVRPADDLQQLHLGPHPALRQVH